MDLLTRNNQKCTHLHNEPSNIPFQDFKRKICFAMIDGQANHRALALVTTSTLNKTPHLLTCCQSATDKGKRQRLQCKLCALVHSRKKQMKVQFLCTGCKAGFHPECHVVYHNPTLLKLAGTDEPHSLVSCSMNKHSKIGKPMVIPRKTATDNLRMITANDFPFWKNRPAVEAESDKEN